MMSTKLHGENMKIFQMITRITLMLSTCMRLSIEWWEPSTQSYVFLAVQSIKYDGITYHTPAKIIQTFAVNGSCKTSEAY